QSRDYFSALFDASPVGYVILDDLGRVKNVNQALAAILEFPAGHCPQSSFTAFLANESIGDFLRHLRLLRFKSKTAHFEVNLRTYNGRILPVELVSSKVERHGQPIEIRQIVIDVSQRREIQQKLAQSQRDFQEMVDALDGMVWEVDAASYQVLFVSRSAERLLGYPVRSWYEVGTWPAYAHPD